METTTFNNRDWFDDIFDLVIVDDDHEDDEKEIQRTILEDYYEDFHDSNDQQDEDQQEEEEEKEEAVDNKNKTNEEEILSQKLIQQILEDIEKRPFNRSSQDEDEEEQQARKKICLVTNQTVQQQSNQITSYIEIMDEMFNRTMSHERIPLKDLRLIMECKYQIEFIRLDLKRWLRYYEIGQRENIWLTEVKHKFSRKQVDEQEHFERDTHQYLEALNTNLKQYQQQLNHYKKVFSMQWTHDPIEIKLTNFIQQYRLVPYLMKSNYQLARFEYEYQDQRIEREFLQQQQQPSEEQIQCFKHLFQLHHDYVKAKKELIELKYRILCNQPIQTDVKKALALYGTEEPIPNPYYYYQEIDSDDKRIQHHLSQCISKDIREGEKKLAECETLFHEQRSTTLLTSSMLTFVHRREQLLEEKFNCTQAFRLDYYLRKRFGQLSDEYHLPRISFTPTVAVHASKHVFTREHFRLLSRGPCYIPPYSMKQADLEKMYKRLQHDVNVAFTKSNVNMVQSMFLQKKIKDLYMNMMATNPLSHTMLERANYEQHLIETIRKDLNIFDLILRRTADEQNVFFLGDRKAFEKVCDEYMLETDRFEVDLHLNDENLQQTRTYIIDQAKAMNLEIQSIFGDPTKYKAQLKKITTPLNQIQLPYLYFLPDLIQQPLTLHVQPIIRTTHHSITDRLGKFLEELLQPIVDIHQQGRTFSNGTDFLRKFDDYLDRGHRLQSNTVFVTIQFHDFHNLVSHELLLSSLLEFFIKSYHLPLVDNIHITKMVRLTRLYLNQNRFYYNNKLYRFKKGGPCNSKFIEILSNIYLTCMDKHIIDQCHLENEFYGRCKNQIFFTWNQSYDKLPSMFQLLKADHSHIQFHMNFGKKVDFLDVDIENRQGQLYSRVYHASTHQLYSLPYVSNGNTIQAHRHWLRSSLIRAVRYCTMVEDFHQERIYLEMTCLANGYPYEFFEKEMEHFFRFFEGKSIIQQWPSDQRLYEKFRRRLFNFMSEQRQYVNKKQEALKKNRRFQLHYVYDHQSAKGRFNKKLREILSETIPIDQTTFQHSKLQFDLRTQQQYSLNTLLTEQRPKHPILNKIH